MAKEQTPDGWDVDNTHIKKIDKSSDGYAITMETGSTFWADNAELKGTVPKVGDELQLYTQGWSWIKGFAINGIVYRYLTKDQSEQKHADMMAEMKAKRLAEFHERIDKWQKIVEGLREPFKKRIRKFEEESGYQNFWTDGGPYELFIYDEANKLLDFVEANYSKNPQSQLNWLAEFKDSAYNDQKILYPGVSEDHSGNTHDAMIGFAMYYLEGKLD